MYIHDYDITDMKIEDGKLEVKTYCVGHEEGAGCTISPYKRVFMLKLNKTEINEVVFCDEYDRPLVQ